MLCYWSQRYFSSLDPELDSISGSLDKASFSDKAKGVVKQTFGILCPPFRELLYGIKALIKRYPSDYTDAFTKENLPITLSTIPFLFFVVFGPAITFGVLMGRFRIAQYVNESSSNCL